MTATRREIATKVLRFLRTQPWFSDVITLFNEESTAAAKAQVEEQQKSTAAYHERRRREWFTR